MQERSARAKLSEVFVKFQETPAMQFGNWWKNMKAFMSRIGMGAKLIAVEYTPEERAIGRNAVARFLGVASAFIECYVALIETSCFRNPQEYGLSKGFESHLIFLREAPRNAVVKSCVSMGHLSALFLDIRINDILAKFLLQRLYNDPIEIDAEEAGICGTEVAALKTFGSSAIGRSLGSCLAFSRDALQLYAIEFR